MLQTCCLNNNHLIDAMKSRQLLTAGIDGLVVSRIILLFDPLVRCLAEQPKSKAQDKNNRAERNNHGPNKPHSRPKAMFRLATTKVRPSKARKIITQVSGSCKSPL